MPVRITSRHAELPEAFQDMVRRKAVKLQRFFQKVDTIDVIFTTVKHRKFCEILVTAGPVKAMGKAENGEEAPAFEKALKACERQVKEQKRRIIDRKHKAINPIKGTNRSGKVTREVAAQDYAI